MAPLNSSELRGGAAMLKGSHKKVAIVSNPTHRRPHVSGIAYARRCYNAGIKPTPLPPLKELPKCLKKKVWVRQLSRVCEI